MKYGFFLFFATFVIQSTASNVSSMQGLSPDTEESTNIQDSQHLPKTNTSYSFDFAKPTKPKAKKEALVTNNRITSDNSAGISLGLANALDTASPSLGLQFTRHDSDWPIEYSMSYYRGIDSLFSVRLRKEANWIESWDSYYKLGIAIALVANQGLASPLHIYNYHSNIGIGCEKFVSNSLKFSVNGDWIFGRQNSILQISSAYTWLW